MMLIPVLRYSYINSKLHSLKSMLSTWYYDPLGNSAYRFENFDQIGIILDFLFFKEVEGRNVVTITEAKKIGLSTEKMSKYLIESF